MKKIKKLKRGLIATILILLSVPVNFSFAAAPKQQYYEIRIYHIRQSSQAERLDSYLKFAFIPAMHRAGIEKVGVFKPVQADTTFGKLVYIFIPVKSMDLYLKLPEKLGKDKAYQKAGREFLDAPYNDPPFSRYESILLKAFEGMPHFMAPSFDTPVSDRIYELRSYESATESKAAKKIDMFSKGGEIKLFENLNFNAVFYGQVLTGSHKPNLMYMTTFRDMTTHDEKWSAFGNSDGWKQLSGLEEYKNTVSKANIYLLHPTTYSDF